MAAKIYINFRKIEDSDSVIGSEIYKLAERLYPICRSITGNGVRKTLNIIKEYVPTLQISEIPTGTKVFDWSVPQEWNIYEAYIEDSTGYRIVDFKDNNLHVIGYSDAMDIHCSKETLLSYIYVQERQPDVIPYVTAYYTKKKGFCMSKVQRDNMKEDYYHAVIKSEFTDGSMTYGEIEIKGSSEKEILLSTYICHPSMANDNLSGPCLCTFLAKWIEQIPNRKYTYRIIFVPETIGAIAYISKNLDLLKKNVIAGYVLSCVGDDRAWSYIPSRAENTLADKAAKCVLHFGVPAYDSYTYLDRGSDERQYNSPGVDLPICVVCRSKYGTYPEYHTSADDLSLISANGFEESYQLYKQIIMCIEKNEIYKAQCLCEPQLGKRGMYATISQKENFHDADDIINFLAYADGRHDLTEISELINVPPHILHDIAERLQEEGLIKIMDTEVH